MGTNRTVLRGARSSRRDEEPFAGRLEPSAVIESALLSGVA
ncbi:hypothetical protein [Ferrimicrobium sp.]|nr:hypothetical protein [Ferrimicrobium sp.]